jgi:hypothetical protein
VVGKEVRCFQGLGVGYIIEVHVPFPFDLDLDLDLGVDLGVDLGDGDPWWIVE